MSPDVLLPPFLLFFVASTYLTDVTRVGPITPLSSVVIPVLAVFQRHVYTRSPAAFGNRITCVNFWGIVKLYDAFQRELHPSSMSFRQKRNPRLRAERGLKDTMLKWGLDVINAGILHGIVYETDYSLLIANIGGIMS